MRRGRRTSHLFLTPTQTIIAAEIVADLDKISWQLIPLLAAKATPGEIAQALGSRWSVPSVQAVIKRFRRYTRDIGTREELQRRLIT